MRLHAIEVGAGPPVVLLHGLFGAAANWGAIQKALSASHRVIALDLRNHGQSPHARLMDYATMAADVAETLAALGALPAVVIGHSMGGKVAMALALGDPGAVARLVVADIAPVAYPPALRGYVAAMQGIPLAPGLTRRDADAVLAAAVPEPGIRGFLLQNLRFDGAVPYWRLGLDQIAQAMSDIEAAPPGGQYPGPVLVLAGARSDYIRAEHHALFRALFPTVTFAVVPGAGHWVHAENPAAFLGFVTAFLAA